MPPDTDPNSVDWEHIARCVGSLREGNGEQGGTKLAQRAIELMLGEDVCRSAVDHYITGKPGSELARSILWHIHSATAMERCYEVYKSSAEIESRRAAVELLRVVADERAIPWVNEFLQDPDKGIQTWGAGIVDQLLWSYLVEPADCQEILAKMQNHTNDQVCKTYEFIQSFLESREERESQ